MLALPFFLFNLKIAFIVFSPYYKCKTCSLTKRKKSSAETDRKKNAPANHLPGMPAHVLTSKPSPTHGICTNTHTHTRVYEHHDTALSGLGCSSVYCLPGLCRTWLPPPQSQERHTLMQTAKAIPCAGSGSKPLPCGGSLSPHGNSHVTGPSFDT